MVCIRHHHTCVYRPAHTWESLFDDTDFVVIYLRSWNFYRRKQHRKILADKNVLSSTPVAAVFSTQRMYAFSCFISLFFLSLILTFFFSFSHPSPLLILSYPNQAYMSLNVWMGARKSDRTSGSLFTPMTFPFKSFSRVLKPEKPFRPTVKNNVSPYR